MTFSMGARLIDDFTRKISSVPFCPYHFVRTILSNTILSVYHFVHTILSVPFCPLPFCPRTDAANSSSRGIGIYSYILTPFPLTHPLHFRLFFHSPSPS